MDIFINYLTTAGGIGTSEITNHRISMIIPVLFISTIFAINMLGIFFASIRKAKISYKFVILVLSGAVLLLTVRTTSLYNNPVYLWFTQAVSKKLTGSLAFAKDAADVAYVKDIKIGQVFKLTPLENKDRECAKHVIEMIPADASVSGPDYLGAQLSLRETYAIFPALYKEADYVIVDVFSRKILTILEVDVSLVRDVVGDVMKNPNYKLVNGCGNLFVYKNVGLHNKSNLLPLQERFRYPEKFNYEIFQKLTVVDYYVPSKVTRGVNAHATLAYAKKSSFSFSDYFLFLSFVNTKTAYVYQIANLPSFGLIQLRNWESNMYYVEDIDLALPKYLDPGNYRVFVGVSNVIKTRSIYLGDVEVL